MTKEKFTECLSGWNSHLPLLWQALESTDGEVVELGMGIGSTPQLHEYCHNAKRQLFSYDNNLEYYKKFEFLRKPGHAIEYTQDWLEPVERHRYMLGVLLSDEAPGHMRKYNIAIFAQNVHVIVVHDTEVKHDHGYLISLVRPLFKYSRDYVFDQVGATAFSNFIDVSQWKL